MNRFDPSNKISFYIMIKSDNFSFFNRFHYNTVEYNLKYCKHICLVKLDLSCFNRKCMQLKAEQAEKLLCSLVMKYTKSEEHLCVIGGFKDPFLRQ